MIVENLLLIGAFVLGTLFGGAIAFGSARSMAQVYHRLIDDYFKDFYTDEPPQRRKD